MTERVKLPPNIYRLPNGGLQFRKVIPKDVRNTIGLSEFKRALGTDIRAASLEGKRLEAEVSKLIYEARQGVSADQAIDIYLKKGAPRTTLRGDSPNLAGHAAALFLVGVHRDQERRRAGELTVDEFQELGAKLLAMHKDVKYVLATGDSLKYKIAVQELFIGQGYLVDATAEQWQTQSRFSDGYPTSWGVALSMLPAPFFCRYGPGYSLRCWTPTKPSTSSWRSFSASCSVTAQCLERSRHFSPRSFRYRFATPDWRWGMPSVRSSEAGWPP